MDLMLKNLNEVCCKGHFKDTAGYIQHGSTSCQLHTIAVAYYSYMLVKLLHIHCRRNELIRGALLHDYFLYDWHMKNTYEGLHGFRHPSVALENACRDFKLNEIEKDIIKKHMFPLTIIPPRSVEGWVVCMVDKACTVYEVFASKPYYNIMKFLIRHNIHIYRCGKRR